MFKKTKEKKVAKIENTNSKKTILFDINKEPFYTVDPKLEDIEAQVALLKEQVIQYESQIATPNFNTEVLKTLTGGKTYIINRYSIALQK